MYIDGGVVGLSIWLKGVLVEVEGYIKKVDFCQRYVDGYFQA